jgi:LysR family transcriptional regulator of beta-lactamase
LTDEGQALLPVLREAFDRVAAALARFDVGRGRELLSVGVVGTFAIGWLLPRLAGFEAAHPEVDLRLTTNNNRVDIAEEGLDFAIRFGDGAWHGTEAMLLFPAPLTVLCDAATAARLRTPADLAKETLCCAPIAARNGRPGAKPPAHRDRRRWSARSSIPRP